MSFYNHYSPRPWRPSRAQFINFRDNNKRIRQLDYHEASAYDYIKFHERPKYGDGKREAYLTYLKDNEKYNEVIIANKVYEKIIDEINKLIEDPNTTVETLIEYINKNYIDNEEKGPIELQKIKRKFFEEHCCREYNVEWHEDRHMKSYANYFSFCILNNNGYYIDMMNCLLNNDKMLKRLEERLEENKYIY